MKAERNSSIELLRIFAAMAVVVVHYNYSFAFRMNSPGGNLMILHLTDSFAISAVNTFMVITGYFSCLTSRRSLGKVASLLFQVSFWHTTFYLVRCIQGTAVPSLHDFVLSIIHPDYFVTLYVVVFVFSPYINRLLNTLTLREFRFLLFLCVIIFSVYAFFIDILYRDYNVNFRTGSPVGITGGQGGCSFVNFCLAYLIGAYIQKKDTHLSCLQAITGFIVCGLLQWFLRYLELHVGVESVKLMARCYHNPLILAQAAFALLFAKGFILRSPVINKLAGAAFTCYMVQFFFFQYIDIEYAVHQSVGYLLSHIVLSACIVYVASYVLYLLYKNTLERIFVPLYQIMIPYEQKEDRK